MPSYETLFLKSLLLTVLVETMTLYPIVRLVPPRREETLSSRLLVFASMTASMLTLPYLWFVAPAFIHDYTSILWLGEVLVWLFEALYYFFVLRVSIAYALSLSLLCNLASFLVGELLKYVHLLG